MELRFSLISDESQLFIEEPIGFDRFEPIIERNDLHGASVEFSDIELDFDDCDAVELIRTKYDESIDSIIELFVEMKCTETDDFSEMYRGLLDLGTIKFSDKKYKSASCKVGQSGVLTTFNNRISTDVSVDDTVSVDGIELPDYDFINNEIDIQGHNLIIKSRSWDENVSEFLPLAYSFEAGPRNVVYSPSMMNSETGDYGGFPSQYPYVVKPSESNDLLLPFFEFDNKNIHIENTQIDYSFHFIIRLENSEENISLEEIYPIATFIIETGEEGGVLENREITRVLTIQPPNVNYHEKEFSVSGSLQNVNFEQLYVYLIITVFVPSNLTPIALQRYSLHTKPKSSYFNVTSNSMLPPTISKVNMLHEMMARITESITNNEMTVWSDYYGRPDSFSGAIKPYQPITFGEGSLRCLTNGYKLRQHKYANGELPKMYLSMKKMVSSLSAIDNIGCGFSFEQGKWWVRVENWKWFYKNIELFEVNNPSNVERSHDLDETFTRLKIGYKKYADISEANVVDTFHSERNYTTLAKAVDKELQAMSELVADPFAIEYTRRKSIDKDTKDWNYDEDIFMICVMRMNVKIESGGVVYSDETTYEVDNGMEETGNTVTSPETMINVYISPARNAQRWADRFSQYPGANGLSYASGTRNTTAKGTRNERISPLVEQFGGLTRTTTFDQAYTSFVQENASINKETSYLKSQKMSFEYPISLQQWNSIRMNPYGYIRVNGERCWIKKVQYNFKTGLTKFELIPEWS